MELGWKPHHRGDEHGFPSDAIGQRGVDGRHDESACISNGAEVAVEDCRISVRIFANVSLLLRYVRETTPFGMMIVRKHHLEDLYHPEVPHASTETEPDKVNRKNSHQEHHARSIPVLLLAISSQLRNLLTYSHQHLESIDRGTNHVTDSPNRGFVSSYSRSPRSSLMELMAVWCRTSWCLLSLPIVPDSSDLEFSLGLRVVYGLSAYRSRSGTCQRDTFRSLTSREGIIIYALDALLE